MKCFIVLLAIVAAVSAGGYHAPQVIQLPPGPQIPAIKPGLLAPHGNDHTTRLHYHGSDVGSPHLVGVEHYHDAPHYEPGWSNVAVHGHGYGHGHGH